MTNTSNYTLATAQNLLLKSTNYSALYEHPNFLIINNSDGETSVFSETESWKEFVDDVAIVLE
jgi:hypothetical protein